jgi:hypothetical protein
MDGQAAIHVAGRLALEPTQSVAGRLALEPI